MWALVILLVWPILLSMASVGSYFWGRQKQFPLNVHGESDMAKRWLSRSSEITVSANKQSVAQEKNFSRVKRSQWFKWFIQPAEAFLNVKVGETCDDIVVGPIALHVDRNTSHPFRKIS